MVRTGHWGPDGAAPDSRTFHDRSPARQARADHTGRALAATVLELRPRYVKLDMQLVRGVDADPARQALIAGMVYDGRQTDCLLVAEGIETEAERLALRLLGVPFGQGFLFGRPAPADAWAERERGEARGASVRPRRIPRAAPGRAG